MPHYANTEQITEQIKYEFKLPKYGKSTTDPTYYEPAATRIANMRKSAQSGKSLYDFEYDASKMKDWTQEQKEKYFMQVHDELRITPGRKPGLTKEEISQNLHDAESAVEKMKTDKEQAAKEYKDEVQKTKSLLNDISASDNADTAEE